jgi:hypothetical protein
MIGVKSTALDFNRRRSALSSEQTPTRKPFRRIARARFVRLMIKKHEEG